jgi:iodotyrosine deiodinase
MTDYRPVPLEFERLGADEMHHRSQEFLELMRARRSVRFFSDEPVPYELLRNAIEVAGTAPSGAHQQPCTFVVVTDPALKQEIRTGAEAEERDFYERRATDRWKEAIKPIGTDWVKTHITDAPYVVVVFEQVYRLAPGGEKIKHYYVKESVGIARGLLSRRGAGIRPRRAHAHAVADGIPRPDPRPPFERAPVHLDSGGSPGGRFGGSGLIPKRLDEILVVR